MVKGAADPSEVLKIPKTAEPYPSKLFRIANFLVSGSGSEPKGGGDPGAGTDVEGGGRDSGG